MHPIVQQIVEIFTLHGSAAYGSEPVTQLEHALQCALLAQGAGASDSLIVAALLHDIGHIVQGVVLPNDVEQDLDDKHEAIGFAFLHQHFGRAIADPVRLHVAAKRYLCSIEPGYENQLSLTSRKSFYDQGGLMSSLEVAAFESEPFFREALQLRKWDDAAKLTGQQAPDIGAFVPILQVVLDQRPK